MFSIKSLYNTTDTIEVVLYIYTSLGFFPSCSLCSLASRQLGKGTTQVKLSDLVKNTTEYNEVVFIYYYSLATKDNATCVNNYTSDEV